VGWYPGGVSLSSDEREGGHRRETVREDWRGGLQSECKVNKSINGKKEFLSKSLVLNCSLLCSLSGQGISNSPRSAGVELILVEDVTVQPENATIYNHPDVKVRHTSPTEDRHYYDKASGCFTCC
jgi:hypothetical protein